MTAAFPVNILLVRTSTGDESKLVGSLCFQNLSYFQFVLFEKLLAILSSYVDNVRCMRRNAIKCSK